MKAFFVTTLILSLYIGAKGQTLNHSQIKLFRFGVFENEKPAVEYPDGTRLDVSAFGEDFNETFFAKDGIKRLQSWLSINAPNCPKVAVNERYGSCVARPSKIIGIGLNYVAHAAEVNQPKPQEPVLFLKASTSLSGANDNIPIPQNSTKLDWEVELAIIIGKKATYIKEEEAMNYIAGFATVNDVSERNFQIERTEQWTKGKSHDGFCPLGPYLVLSNNIENPQNLNLWLTVNGQKMQTSNTNDMIFGIKELVSFVSKFMTLLPGDIIVTGTPAGVGTGRNPQVFLKEGDIVELEVEQLGKQKQKVVSFIESQLNEADFKEFQAWVAIGVGGLPHTLEGFRTLQSLNKKLKNPLDITHLKDKVNAVGDIKTLKNLPKRTGTKPNIAPFAIPHRQLDQHNTQTVRDSQKKIFDESVAEYNNLVHYQKSYFEKHNDAILLLDSAKGNQTIVTTTHGEVGHLHPTDGSMHFSLSPSDTKEVLEKGWGELHGLAGQVYKGKDALPMTYTMIYSPRNDQELAIIKQIIKAAILYDSLPINGK